MFKRFESQAVYYTSVRVIRCRLELMHFSSLLHTEDKYTVGYIYKEGRDSGSN